MKVVNAMLNGRRGLTVVILAALLAAGCSSGDDESSEDPLTTAAACAEDCSGKEVTDTGCDKNAVDAVPAKPVKVAEGPHGSLGLRKSNPAACSGIYWVRFQPDADNQAPFEVEISVNGRVAKPQPSEPGNPVLEAWTVGVHAEPGEPITACVWRADRKEGVCLETVKAA
ncbi:MAG TPA: hypothetical protein VFZ62_01935 [Candidatus Saccharimonadales bacterium]